MKYIDIVLHVFVWARAARYRWAKGRQEAQYKFQKLYIIMNHNLWLYISGFNLPYKQILDGKSVKMEISKAFDMNKDTINVDYNTHYDIASG